MTSTEGTLPPDVVAPTSLTLGRLSVTVDGIDLRDIRWSGIEAIRRVYPVFQDLNWTNRAFRVLDRTIEVDDARLTMTASGTGSFDAAPLRWEVTASVTSEEIDYRFVARTDKPFERNRLGLCLLHPMAAAGSACRVSHVGGASTEGRLPAAISPQQPFVDITAISHEVTEGLWATVEFTGDVFEMEDHRNWSDASFKTYCTPITLPFPVTVAPGDVIDQSLRIRFTGTTPQATLETDPETVVTVSETSAPLPRLGIGLNAEELIWPHDVVARVRALGLDHCRVAVRAQDPDTLRVIRDAASLAASIGTSLHVAVTCREPADLAAMRALPSSTVGRVARWTVFSAEHKVTPAHWASAARQALGDAIGTAELGGGTDLYFTELNREPPGPSDFDVTNFALTPQVHAFDDRTLIQNAIAQSVIASDAPRVCEGTRISVAPITLRPRFNPNATDPERDVSSTPLPSDVDARQRTWFAACWTASSVKHLSEPGTIESITYYETPGWKGILTGDDPAPDPVHFPTQPGEGFPVLTVFEALAGATTMRHCSSTQPEVIDALIVDGPDGIRLIMINWSTEPHHVSVVGSLTADLEAAPQTVTITDLPVPERTP